MTVSRVLNAPELVAEAMREKVLKAIQDLDYVVNELARQIGTGRRPYIGILSLGVATTPFAVDIISAVEQVTREHGWRAYVVNSSTHDPSPGVLDHILALRPEGIIVATVGHYVINVHERLVRSGVVLASCQTVQKGIQSKTSASFVIFCERLEGIRLTFDCAIRLQGPGVGSNLLAPGRFASTHALRSAKFREFTTRYCEILSFPASIAPWLR
jgi:hypothetical protein